MTVSSTTSRWAYTGNGATTAFSVNNKLFADSDLLVYLDDTLQTLTTHYTVALNADQDASPGGTVTFLAAPGNTLPVVIVRNVANTQESDFPLGGPLPARVVEDGLDRRTIVAQQMADTLARALRYRASEASVPSAEMPALADLMGNVLGFHPTTGAPIAVAGTIGDAGDLVTAYIATVLASADQAAFRTNTQLPKIYAGGTSTAVGAAHTITVANYTTLTDGDLFQWVVGAAITGASTLQVNSTAAGALKYWARGNLQDVVSGDLALGQSVISRYVGGVHVILTTRATDAAGFQLRTFQHFTSSGTHNTPSGCRALLVECQGAGGGGGGCSNAANIGCGGGGAGGYSRKWITSPDISTVVTIGAAGAAGANTGTSGGTGGTSSFGSACSATGGVGGTGATTAGGKAGGAGGVGSGGDLNLAGGGGGAGAGDTNFMHSGLGGASRMGGGGAATADNAGNAGNLGGGGSGASGATTARAGGAGGGGIVVVWEFY